MRVPKLMISNQVLPLGNPSSLKLFITKCEVDLLNWRV